MMFGLKFSPGWHLLGKMLGVFARRHVPIPTSSPIIGSRFARVYSEDLGYDEIVPVRTLPKYVESPGEFLCWLDLLKQRAESGETE